MLRTIAYVWALSASMASAQCRVCDEVVELNGTLAQCFTSNFERFHQTAKSDPTGRVKIDMTTCADASGNADRGGLLTMPSLRPDQKPLKSVYVLDVAYLECLRVLVDGHEGPLDPSVQFDLFEQCSE